MTVLSQVFGHELGNHLTNRVRDYVIWKNRQIRFSLSIRACANHTFVCTLCIGEECIEFEIDTFLVVNLIERATIKLHQIKGTYFTFKSNHSGKSGYFLDVRISW